MVLLLWHRGAPRLAEEEIPMTESCQRYPRYLTPGCAPFDPLQQPPSEVVDVRLEMIDAVTSHMSWPAVSNALTYSVSREQLESLTATGLGPCASSGNPNTFFDDPLLPPGQGFFYLVKAEGCGSGPLGTDSSGTERVNEHPGACP